MAVLLHPYDGADAWFAALSDSLAAHVPDQRIDRWPDVADPDAVEFLVTWRHPAADLVNYPNLRAILSLGAGVEQFLADDYPRVPVVRLADTVMSDEMAQYAMHWVMHFQRRFDALAEQQTDKVWAVPDYVSAHDHVVGILGFGNIGRHIATTAQALGYPVASWSRSGSDMPGVTSFAGADQLPDFLGTTHSVINVLPSTPSTRKLLSTTAFAQFRPGSVLINIGRGATVDEEALVTALDDGALAHAVLDVTTVEPLPADSPLWSHAGVTVTPHIAGATQKRSASELIAANIARILNDEEPFPVLDRERGY